MEKLKQKNKLLYLFLSLLLVFSMVVVVPTKAIGATQHNIKINNAGKNETYTAYQVFYKDGNNYAISKSSPFYPTILDYNADNVATPEKQIQLQDKVGDTNVSIAAVTSSFLESEAKILAEKFKAISSWPSEATYKKASATAAGDGTCTLESVDNGYYAITSTFGPKIALVTVYDEDVTINEKNTESELGELSFDIDRDAYGYSDYADIITQFRFTNSTPYSLANGHDLIIGNTFWYTSPLNGVNIAIFRNFNSNENIKVYYKKNAPVGYTPNDGDLLVPKAEPGTTQTGTPEYTMESQSPSYANWRITFDNTYKPNLEEGEIFGQANDLIYVKVRGIVWNDLNVTDNDGESAAYEPFNVGSGIDHRGFAKVQTKEGDKYKDQLVRDDSFRVLGTSLIKIITGDESGNVLDGAKFKLYFKNDPNGDVLRFTTSVTADGKKVLTVAGDQDTGSEIIEAGAVDIVGLGDGNYWLSEIEAPEGYNKLDGMRKVTPGVKVDIGGGEYVWASSFNKTITQNPDTGKIVFDPTTRNQPQSGTIIQNSKGIIIPGTGGIGTTIFIVAGFVLILTGVVFCATRRKLHKQTVIINK